MNFAKRIPDYRSRTKRKPRQAKMNVHAIRAIYCYEMSRTLTNLFRSAISPIVLTVLYFVVFGSAIGSLLDDVKGLSYGSYIVPGVLMLAVLNQGVTNASLGIFYPKLYGTIYELRSAPVSPLEILLGYVGAAASKCLLISIIVLSIASFFVDLRIVHPVWLINLLVLTSVSFSLIGFATGLWAENYEKLQLIPMFVFMPLIFLGGTFYSIDMLPEIWRTINLANPILYLGSGFRWSFYGISEVHVGLCLLISMLFFVASLAIVWIMLKRIGFVKQ